MTPNILAALTNIGIALISIGLAVPLAKRKVKMNPLYGVRFTKSFESDELWYQINEHGGRRLVFWSVVLLAVGLGCFVAPPWLVTPLFFAPMIYVIPCVESYLYAEKL